MSRAHRSPFRSSSALVLPGHQRGIGITILTPSRLGSDLRDGRTHAEILYAGGIDWLILGYTLAREPF
jgi:hypothetical protein